MTRSVRGLYRIILILGAGTSCAGSALAADKATEEVAVAAPFTIREENLPGTFPGRMPMQRVTVETNVSFSDLDLSKAADVDTMKERIRSAAREDCRELDRRFPQSVYVPVGSSNCIRSATNDAMARLNEVRGSAMAQRAVFPAQR